MGNKELRELDVKVDSQFFGFKAEVTAMLNGQVSAMRVRRNGNFTYLPEYSTNIRDSFLIFNAIKKMNGTYSMIVDKGGCVANAKIGKAEWQSDKFDNMEEAICDLAIKISDHPLFLAKLQPLILDETDVPATVKEVKREENSIKRAWYDAR